MRIAKYFKLKTVLLSGAMLIALQGAGQDQHQSSEPARSLSFMTGGIIIGESTLWVNKFSMEHNHIGVLLDITRDTYNEAWNDGSTGKYRLWSFSAAGRYYLKPIGRSLFAELSMGVAAAKLIVNVNTGGMIGRESVARPLPLASWGLGWRFGKNKSRLFGEVGFRSALPLKTLHMYTAGGESPENKKESIAYHSWYFERFKGTSQLYLGIGYSLWKQG